MKKNYVLKSEFEGKIVSRRIPKQGSVDFDTKKVGPQEYENYARMGFDDCFEITEQPVMMGVKWLKTEDLKEDEKDENNTNGDDLDLGLQDLPILENGSDADGDDLEKPIKPIKKSLKK